MNLNAQKKIKIAQIVTRLDYGGAPDIVEILCSRLDPAIYDVTLIYGRTVHFSAKSKEFFSRFGGKLILISHLKRDISFLDDLAALVRLYLVLQREKFDIVHTHTAKAGFIGRLAAKLAGVAVIMHTPHGHIFYGYFNSLESKFIAVLERIAAFFTDRIIVLTALEKKDMIKHRICAGFKIDRIPSGIDLSRLNNLNFDFNKKRAEFKIGSEELLVGMVSRLESVKGCSDFIESAKFICKQLPKTRFIIVGEGSLRADLILHSRRLNMEQQIIFTGWREDIPEILSILDVLVQPSLNEAVGRIILEAGAVGKPTVATDVGGIPEVLINGETGLLVPPGDPQAMAQAIISLLKDKQKRAKMGSAAQYWVRSNFDENRMLENLHQIYIKELNI